MTAAEMPLTGWKALAPARQRAGLSMMALYFRYVALGGTASPKLLQHHFTDGAALADLEHDLAVLAINERFLELDAPERLPFAQPSTLTDL